MSNFLQRIAEEGEDGVRYDKLRQAAKRALLLLNQDNRLVLIDGRWKCSTGQHVQWHTIEELFDLYLIKVSVDAASPRGAVARLSDIGRHVARDLARRAEGEIVAPKLVSEEAALFITEVVSP